MGNKLVVLGAGESGVGAALLAKAKGYEVFVSDFGKIKGSYKKQLQAEGIPFEEGKHTESLIFDATEIVKSPGIPDKALVVQKAVSKNIPVFSEIEFAARYTNAKFIAITGSNGKTTTTLLTYHLIKSAGYKVGLAGNIGESLAKQVIEDKNEYYVLELSSFQLDGMYDFKAHVAILLNITPDHLDRYDYNFDNYVNSKFRITQNMTYDDYFITFTDDQVISDQLFLRDDIQAFKLGISLENRTLNGAFLSNGKLNFNINNHITKMFAVEENIIPLNGKHNMINTMAAIMAALAVKVDQEVIFKAIGSFKNAAHRLEHVAMINGARYVNDSKATNVDSVKYALESFQKPIIWIAGGVDKGNDYGIIEEQVYEKVKAIICLGKDNSKLKKAFGEKVGLMFETEKIAEAVQISTELCEEGAVVLLSPACASFDLFKNYEDRGDQFKKEVKSLENNQFTKNLMSFVL